VFLENFDKATHVSAFELVGEVDGKSDGGDGILGSVSTVADDDGVAESFDADLIDPEISGIRGGLGVWEGIGMGRGRFQRMLILPQFRVQGKGGRCGEDAAILDVSPRLRDTLTRGFYISDWGGDCSRPAGLDFRLRGGDSTLVYVLFRLEKN